MYAAMFFFHVLPVFHEPASATWLASLALAYMRTLRLRDVNTSWKTAVGLPHLTRGRDRGEGPGHCTPRAHGTARPPSLAVVSSQSQLLLITLARTALAVRSRPARAPPGLTGRPRLASLGLAYKFRATPTPALSGLSTARKNPTKPSYQLGHLITRPHTQRGN
jgi:hypothetical protein